MNDAPTPGPPVEPVAAYLEDRHRRLVRELDRWVPDQIESLEPAQEDDEARNRAREILSRLGNGGWIRFALPEEHGGSPEGPDLRSCCLIRETLAAASPLADAVFALQALGAMPVTLAGTREQKRSWLPAIGAGDVMTAFAMTEPGAGSDVSAIATEARREEEGSYRLEGEKTLISNAGIADLYVLFASTGTREDGRNQISTFLVPGDVSGLELAEAQVLSSPHPLGRIRLQGCPVPAGNRLGDEGEGFRIGMRTLERLRPTVAAAACGMAGRALREALAHARSRRQFGAPLAEHQLVREKIARMATRLDASRLLVYRAAAALDRGSGDREGVDTAAWSSMAKAEATEAGQAIVDEAIQIVGGRACLADHPLDRLYRSIRALRIYEGTTEIQRLVLARRILEHEE